MRMLARRRMAYLAGGAAIIAITIGTTDAHAQATVNAPGAEQAATPSTATPVVTSVSPAGPAADDIVVTGSRIARSKTETPMPVTVISSQTIADRGFVTAAQALNNEPSINTQLNQTLGDGTSTGDGVQAPSLFGLGTGRTLTLFNGRRMVTTSSGLDDPEVDSNVIPLGLLQRVEVVQGGGAAVYGSDAISGVVNYVLRKDFSGVEADVQGGITSRGDYPNYSARITAGTNFAGGRGNVAVDAGWSRIGFLPYGSRPRTRLDRILVDNPDDAGPADGRPSNIQIFDARFWTDNFNGIVFSRPTPSGRALLPFQFSGRGDLMGYSPGTIYGVPFASGGDGLRYQDLVAGLRTGVERFTANAIGHYDLTAGVTVSTELLYARTDALEGLQVASNSVLGSEETGTSAIPFTIGNPFLSRSAASALAAASPAFAAGEPLYLSKDWNDLTPDTFRRRRTETYRALLGINGNLDVAGRTVDWSVSASYARVDGVQRSNGVVLSRFNNALSATRDAAGQIVCSINTDADPGNDDRACAPIDFFGPGRVSDAARRYIGQVSGSRYRNEQVDILASASGSLLTLPAGELKVAATYEHREERARFTPFQGDADGIFTGGASSRAASGRYHTNEIAGEVLIPVIGKDFSLPLARSVDLSGAFRYVDNSLAGGESVWNVGLRWEPLPGLTLRGSRSRNFRAPSLNALVAPATTALDAGGADPCDRKSVAGGPNPAQRRASCLALFQANPTYGTGGPDGLAPGSSAADRLANFSNSGTNFFTTLVTTRGNPELRNEISKTWTYGLIFQPMFIPRLTITADRIEIDLTDGFSLFTTEAFAAACYDDPNPSRAVCDAFSRLSAPTQASQAGSYATGTTTTFNAGSIRFRGETYTLNYVLPTDTVFASSKGRLELDVSATHTSLLDASVTGAVLNRYDNTSFNPLTQTSQPKWVGRLDLSYTEGPLRLSYQGFYLGSAVTDRNATAETTQFRNVASNLTHSLSVQVEAGNMSLRAGVTNLTDRQPSYPTLNYGDIIGRSFFVGARMRY